MHCMIDLETLGTRPGCVILSIGAVMFDVGAVYRDNTFKRKLSIASQKAIGLHIDPSTDDWWKKQAPEAVRENYTPSPSDLPLGDALIHLADWMQGYADLRDIRVWSNGADFDIPILAEAHRLNSLPLPWKYYNQRCYRTLKSQFTHILPPEKNKTAHDALSDALYQAAHASRILTWIYTDPRLAKQSSAAESQVAVASSAAYMVSRAAVYSTGAGALVSGTSNPARQSIERKNDDPAAPAGPSHDFEGYSRAP